jgi:hypothetical protein
MEEESHCPLRWESTGDQWWYATPVDWAAASVHYDVVRELLRLDANLLIKLTSLRRMRRLESVWDDDMHFADAATNRAAVAWCLLREDNIQQICCLQAKMFLQKERLEQGKSLPFGYSVLQLWSPSVLLKFSPS